MLKVILFDVDGVLIKTRTADATTYQKMFVAAGYDEPDLSDVQKVEHLPLWEGVKLLLKTDDIDKINRVRDILLPPEVSHTSFIKPPDNLHEVIQQLARTYRLGIVTGRFKQGMQELFTAYPFLQQYFEQVVTYEDTEEHKPRPEPLLLALQKMDVSPDETVYVGDMGYDIEAADNAGMRSIHLSRKPSAEARAWISDFDQLIEAVTSLDA